MAHVISFTTARFDVSIEPPNPINPIAGRSILDWLREPLAKAGYRSTEPDTEDWGWYIDVEGGGASYLVGASADAETDGPDVEWVVQVHRHRSLTDRLLGRNTMEADDRLFALIERIVRSESDLETVVVEKEA